MTTTQNILAPDRYTIKNQHIHESISTKITNLLSQISKNPDNPKDIITLSSIENFRNYFWDFHKLPDKTGVHQLGKHNIEERIGGGNHPIIFF